MTITREQVADLQPGDVVEVRFPDGYVVRGPVVEKYGCLELGPHGVLRFEDGDVPTGAERRTLTVVSRAPRPLYVNHPRTEPVPGDVVRTSRGFVYSCTTTPSWVGSPEHGCETPWRSTRHGGYDAGPVRDNGLRLLVDGETGQVVP